MNSALLRRISVGRGRSQGDGVGENVGMLRGVRSKRGEKAYLDGQTVEESRRD